MAMELGETFGSTGQVEGRQRIARRRARRVVMDAAAIGCAMRNGAIELVYQPIVGIGRLDQILYWECRARLRLADGRLLVPELFLPCLNRLEVVTRLDAFVLRRAIALLGRWPTRCLGIQVSPFGIGELAWWKPVLTELARHPEVARRLVFEIQEAAVLVPGSGRAIRKALREAGCLVAINGFGVRYGVQTAMEIEAPDMIKLDRSLLWGLGKKGARRMIGMVALARDLAPQVIVDGVNSAAALQVAREAGAQWAQGGLVGSERLIPRRVGAVDQRGCRADQ
ncbi:hypothetical protein WK65_08700 [Burkholderia ubonensis]|uniref:EAL domain-containing protein n=1 Tax=Burkholderia ubonensis TaxID=101571 RepID=UPI00075D3A4F|nr:EAL domain-containing protein [Burkholderia ubonensis]KVU27440.1 hypothetical protein WK65_08700 [Burkholderia ubonensis]